MFVEGDQVIGNSLGNLLLIKNIVFWGGLRVINRVKVKVLKESNLMFLSI